MNTEEKQRYSRHIILPEIGIEGQLQLKNTSVLMVGAGGLGCPVLQYLGAAGIGKIGILDFDTIDESNLHRQILFTTNDLGKYKAEVAKERLLANNPYIEVTTHLERLEKDNALEIIKNYDIVVDGTDNFATRYLVNDTCVLLNKTLVFGAIYKFQGQLSVFNYKGGPSYRCLFPEQPEANSIPTCSQIGVVGVLPGIIGSMQANEVIKVALDRDDVLSGRFLTIDILSNIFSELSVTRQASNFEMKELGNYEDACTEVVVPEISVDELDEAYEDYFVLDIRPKEERDICALPNSFSVEKKDLEEKVAELPRNKSIVVYCHFGKQSQEVVSLLKDKYGFGHVYNLSGGIHEWSQEIDSNILIY